MTANQLRYWELQETKRSNLARETETNRSNLAQEKEANRSNTARELETNRNNTLQYVVNADRNDIQDRYNYAKLNIDSYAAEVQANKNYNTPGSAIAQADTDSRYLLGSHLYQNNERGTAQQAANTNYKVGPRDNGSYTGSYIQDANATPIKVTTAGGNTVNRMQLAVNNAAESFREASKQPVYYRGVASLK